MDTKLKEKLKEFGHSQEVDFEAMLDILGNTFVRLERNGASWRCEGKEEINNTVLYGYGITAFESVTRLFVAVQEYYKKINNNK